MACEGCRRRREAMRRAAQTITRSVSETLSKVMGKPAPAPANLNDVGCCTLRATKEGWVNVCRHCHAQSDPSPTPSANAPKCKPDCPRK